MYAFVVILAEYADETDSAKAAMRILQHILQPSTTNIDDGIESP